LRSQYLARNHVVRIFELVFKTKLFNDDLIHRLLRDRDPDVKTKQLY